MLWSALELLFAVPVWAGALLGLPWWLSASLAVVVPSYVYLTWTFGHWTSVGVCGPRPLPLVGNFHLMATEGFSKDHEYVANVFEMRNPVLIICDAELVKEVAIKNFDHFQNRRSADNFPIQKEIKGAVSLKNGDSWKGMRNVITPTFSASKMKRISSIISECGVDFVKALHKVAGTETDMKTMAGSFTMDAVGRTMFGIEANCQEDTKNPFVVNSKKAFDFTFLSPKLWAMLMLPSAVIKPIFEWLNWGTMDSGVLGFFRTQVNAIIALRKAQKEKSVDFIQLLLDAHETEMEEAGGAKVSSLESTEETYSQVQDWRVGKRALTEQEILSNAIIFLLVGYETTASALSWMFHLLAFHPDVQEKLFQEIRDKMAHSNGLIGYEEVAAMPYLDAVFCETLRLYPSAQRSDRECTAATSVGEVPMAKGDILMFSIWGIQRDPEYWPEPDEFRPERFAPENKANIRPYTWIPFGAGPRNCIGMRLAILEAKIGLAYALHNFRFAPGPNSKQFPELGVTGFTAPKDKKLPLLIHLRSEQVKE